MGGGGHDFSLPGGGGGTETFCCCFGDYVLVLFLEENYPNVSDVFWPDKASAHYARATCSLLDNHGVNYVPKDLNPTAVP